MKLFVHTNNDLYRIKNQVTNTLSIYLSVDNNYRNIYGYIVDDNNMLNLPYEKTSDFYQNIKLFHPKFKKYLTYINETYQEFLKQLVLHNGV